MMLRSIGAISRQFPAVSATVNVVPSGLTVNHSIPATAVQTETEIVLDHPPAVQTNSTLTSQIPTSVNLSVTTGLGSKSQVRYAHTDIRVPDFSAYRRSGTQNERTSSEPTAIARKGFTYLTMLGGSAAFAYGGKNIVQGVVDKLNPTADVLALAKIEVEMAEVPEGSSRVFKWRGKPVFVRHRTDEEISEVRGVDINTLRDPESDQERVVDEKWLVVLGICTHLGCVPVADAGAFGGYYCPCHGSHYDASGRIRQGPAPLNLEVPEHSFPGEGLIIIG